MTDTALASSRITSDSGPTPLARSAIRTSTALFIYVLAYVALRLLPNTSYAAYLNTVVQLAGDAACVYLAARAARQVDDAWRGFFRAIMVAAVFLLIANVAWGIIINLWAVDPNVTLESLAYRLPYLVCLVFWAAAWMQIVVRNLNRGATASLIVTAVLLGTSLAVMLVDYYGALIFDSANPHRVFVLLYVGLEITALIFCMGAAMIQVQPYPVLIAIGYSLLVAADFVFNTNELRDTVQQNSLVEIPWTVAQACIALGVQAQWLALREKALRPAAETNWDRHFAIPLLCVTLGSGFAGGVIARFVHPQPVTFGCYLFFTAAVAIAVSVLAKRHSQALEQAFQTVSTIIARGSTPAAPPSENGLLRLFGSAALIKKIERLLVANRSRMIPYGSDGLFPIEEAWRSEKQSQVFIAMPFAASWSSSTDRWFRRVVNELQWTAVRADELFDSRDALVGIWKGIVESEVVLADLTDRNPNVLYEVGLAHCLGKPVVFACQRADDIPFDLATRRIVLYDPAAPDASAATLRLALLACSSRQ